MVWSKGSNICILPELGVGGWKILEEFISNGNKNCGNRSSFYREAATNELFQFD